MRVPAGGLLALVLIAACQPSDAPDDRQTVDRAAAYRRAAELAASGDVTARLEQIFFEQQAPRYVRDSLWHLIRAAYDRRQYQPYWIEGPGSTRAADLVASVCSAEREGLRSSDYHVDQLRTEVASLDGDARGGADRLARIDLLLTGALLAYSEDLLMGRVRPDRSSAWHVDVPRDDVERLLQRILTEPVALDSTFAELRPATAAYAPLAARLAELRAAAAAGGWDTIAAGPVLRRGARGPRVAALRRRLVWGGELRAGDTAGTTFDASLAAAVARFQRAHGAPADGIVGEATRAALNTPVEQRIAQVEATLERYRWIPDELLPRYALVDVPTRRVVAVVAGTRVVDVDARIDTTLRRRLPPVLADTIARVVLHPVWEVPADVVTQHLLPALRADRRYGARLGLEVVRGQGGGAEVISPAEVDWRTIGGSTTAFSVRQLPGPRNALGAFRFSLRRESDLYLHAMPESPDRRLSAAPGVRSIAVQRPLELASVVVPGWDSTRLRAALAARPREPVEIAAGVPVFVLNPGVRVADDRISFAPAPSAADLDLAAALGPARPLPADACRDLGDAVAGLLRAGS